MKQLIYFVFLNLIFTTNIFSQCFDPDPTIWQNTWSSCQTSQNPISDYGNTHWIQYDFGKVRKLSKTWVWNCNEPGKLEQGFQLVKIDHSQDGQNWEHWGEMSFPKAMGTPIYGGFSGPDLMNVEAQFVLVTVLSNHGDADCAGIAEIKFNLLPDGTGGTPPDDDDDDDEPQDCAIVENFFVEEVTENEAFIVWDLETEEEEFFFLFEYRMVGEEDFIGIETEEMDIFLENLEPETDYEFRIGVECEEEILYSENGAFFTEGEEEEDCGAVESIWEEFVNEEEALILWEEVEGAEFYLLEGGIVDDSEIVEMETEEPEIYLEDLVPFTEYWLRVGVECEDKILWSSNFYFFTEEVEWMEINTTTANQFFPQLKVFPNPTTGLFEFNYQSEMADKILYSIRNIDGRILMQNTAQISQGFNKVNLDLSDFVDGIYMLNIESKNQKMSVSKRIVKIK